MVKKEMSIHCKKVLMPNNHLQPTGTGRGKTACQIETAVAAPAVYA